MAEASYDTPWTLKAKQIVREKWPFSLEELILSYQYLYEYDLKHFEEAELRDFFEINTRAKSYLLPLPSQRITKQNAEFQFYDSPEWQKLYEDYLFQDLQAGFLQDFLLTSELFLQCEGENQDFWLNEIDRVLTHPHAAAFDKCVLPKIMPYFKLLTIFDSQVYGATFSKSLHRQKLSRHDANVEALQAEIRRLEEELDECYRSTQEFEPKLRTTPFGFQEEDSYLNSQLQEVQKTLLSLQNDLEIAKRDRDEQADEAQEKYETLLAQARELQQKLNEKVGENAELNAQIEAQNEKIEFSQNVNLEAIQEIQALDDEIEALRAEANALAEHKELKAKELTEFFTAVEPFLSDSPSLSNITEKMKANAELLKDIEAQLGTETLSHDTVAQYVKKHNELKDKHLILEREFDALESKYSETEQEWEQSTEAAETSRQKVVSDLNVLERIVENLIAERSQRIENALQIPLYSDAANEFKESFFKKNYITADETQVNDIINALFQVAFDVKLTFMSTILGSIKRNEFDSYLQECFGIVRQDTTKHLFPVLEPFMFQPYDVKTIFAVRLKDDDDAYFEMIVEFCEKIKKFYVTGKISETPQFTQTPAARFALRRYEDDPTGLQSERRGRPQQLDFSGHSISGGTAAESNDYVAVHDQTIEPDLDPRYFKALQILQAYIITNEKEDELHLSEIMSFEIELYLEKEVDLINGIIGKIKIRKLVSMFRENELEFLPSGFLIRKSDEYVSLTPPSERTSQMNIFSINIFTGIFDTESGLMIPKNIQQLLMAAVFFTKYQKESFVPHNLSEAIQKDAREVGLPVPVLDKTSFKPPTTRLQYDKFNFDECVESEYPELLLGYNSLFKDHGTPELTQAFEYGLLDALLKKDVTTENPFMNSSAKVEYRGDRVTLIENFVSFRVQSNIQPIQSVLSRFKQMYQSLEDAILQESSQGAVLRRARGIRNFHDLTTFYASLLYHLEKERNTFTDLTTTRQLFRWQEAFDKRYNTKTDLNKVDSLCSPQRGMAMKRRITKYLLKQCVMRPLIRLYIQQAKEQSEEPSATPSPSGGRPAVPADAAFTDLI